jgi:hypothetical protein
MWIHSYLSTRKQANEPHHRDPFPESPAQQSLTRKFRHGY